MKHSEWLCIAMQVGAGQYWYARRAETEAVFLAAALEQAARVRLRTSLAEW